MSLGRINPVNVCGIIHAEDGPDYRLTRTMASEIARVGSRRQRCQPRESVIHISIISIMERICCCNATCNMQRPCNPVEDCVACMHPGRIQQASHIPTPPPRCSTPSAHAAPLCPLQHTLLPAPCPPSAHIAVLHHYIRYRVIQGYSSKLRSKLRTSSTKVPMLTPSPQTKRAQTTTNQHARIIYP